MTENKTVLITGTSSGIGLAAAVAAAQAGWQVVATMRNTAKAQKLLDSAREVGVAELIEVGELDVQESASVTRCIDAVIAAHGHLDAVVNNAGVGMLGTAEHLDVKDIRTAMEINFFGVVSVSQAALPHLRASRGRLLTVTSVGGVVGQPFNDAYCAAKFAVEGFMESLAPVAATAGVRVSVIEPGAVASEFVASQQVDVPALVAAAGPYAPAMQAYIKRAQATFGNAQSAADAAAAIVATLDADEPPFRVQTSEQARTFAGTKLADVDGTRVQAMTGEWVSG